jgi:hypothetical protein
VLPAKYSRRKNKTRNFGVDLLACRAEAAESLEGTSAFAPTFGATAFATRCAGGEGWCRWWDLNTNDVLACFVLKIHLFS